jgi:hypothetical protein
MPFPNSHLFLRVFSKYQWILVFILIGRFPSFSQEVTPVKKVSADTVRKPVSKPTTPPVRTGRGSQIVDDSTRSVYGPKTTKWVTESKVFENKADYRPLDTTLSDYHRWTYIQGLNNFDHDLGNVGTALNPIFPGAPLTVGASSGFQTYYR